MRTAALDRFGFVWCFVIVCLLGIWPRAAVAIPSFESIDSRLPNPDRAYEMTSGTVALDVQGVRPPHAARSRPSDPTIALLGAA